MLKLYSKGITTLYEFTVLIDAEIRSILRNNLATPLNRLETIRPVISTKQGLLIIST